MALRTDRDRFRDVRYVEALLRAWLGLDVLPMTPEQKKTLDEEMRQFNEYYKGVADAMANLLQLGLRAVAVFEYFQFVRDTFGTPATVGVVFKYTMQFSTESRSAVQWIEYVVKNRSTISQRMAGLTKNSGKFLGFLLCFQLIIQASRGDYAKMVGELAKTVLCSAYPPAALIDLIDSLVGLLVPEWILQQPVVRVLRGMNPAQCTDYIVSNMCWLVYCGTVAKQRGWGEFEKALGAWCDKMEQSPMAIYTFLARDFASMLNEILPNSVSSFSVFGASIRNLADYNRANPVSY